MRGGIFFTGGILGNLVGLFSPVLDGLLVLLRFVCGEACPRSSRNLLWEELLVELEEFAELGPVFLGFLALVDLGEAGVVDLGWRVEDSLGSLHLVIGEREVSDVDLLKEVHLELDLFGVADVHAF